MERENIRDWNYHQDGHMQNELESNGVFRFSSLSMDHSEKEFEDFFSSNGVHPCHEIGYEDSTFQNELERPEGFQPLLSNMNSNSSTDSSFQQFGSQPLPSCGHQSLIWHAHHHHHHRYSDFMEEDLDKKGSVEPTVSGCGHGHLHQEKSLRKKSTATREDKMFCNCEKSKCLKMYCNCYRSGVACSERCRCRQCSNTPVNQKHIQTSKLESQRIAEEVYQASSEVYCSCRRSFCEKSYCPCLRSKTGCSPKCKCFHCKNTFGPKSDYHHQPPYNPRPEIHCY
jgi:Tesmin/TSO1-like CXC domain, cysteine-rich domain